VAFLLRKQLLGLQVFVLQTDNGRIKLVKITLIYKVAGSIPDEVTGFFN
jgi:hypothetical protein